MSSSPTATTPATEKKPDASPTPSTPEAELFKVSLLHVKGTGIMKTYSQKKVFVGNLSFSTTDESLEAFFGQTGKV